MSTDDTRLRSYIDRIQRLQDERKDLTRDIREVFLEAKSNGYDVKIMRRALRILSQNDAERVEAETLLAAYMAALGRPLQADLFEQAV